MTSTWRRSSKTVATSSVSPNIREHCLILCFVDWITKQDWCTGKVGYNIKNNKNS